jgi:hypothetical protein
MRFVLIPNISLDGIEHRTDGYDRKMEGKRLKMAEGKAVTSSKLHPARPPHDIFRGVQSRERQPQLSTATLTSTVRHIDIDLS